MSLGKTMLIAASLSFFGAVAVSRGAVLIEAHGSSVQAARAEPAASRLNAVALVR
jgi:hypothetical protein